MTVCDDVGDVVVVPPVPRLVVVFDDADAGECARSMAKAPTTNSATKTSITGAEG
jgi:hypothetical protein